MVTELWVVTGDRYIASRHGGSRPYDGADMMILRAISCAFVECLLLCAGPPTTSEAATKVKKTSSLPFVDDVARKPATTGGAPKKTGVGMTLLPGSGSKEPININSDKLDFLNKENKLIYTGHVVAVQGDSTLKASKLNIDLEKDTSAAATPAPTDAGASAAGNSSVRHMEADGPVTMISKDQIGTGDHATYDKAENKVYLKGSVTLTQGPNVIQGDNLVYDMPSGQAQVVGNVRSVFMPSKGAQGGATKGQADKDMAR